MPLSDCALQAAFNLSNASHSLLTAFRALSPGHGQVMATKTKAALQKQLELLLPQAQALGPVCIPTLPAEQREPYVRQVLKVQGLANLASAVARNATAMQSQVGTGTLGFGSWEVG